jgi:signal-transduction protein with cAMP-binding, CBS, and nucleotidyltransferase domain
MSLIEDVMHENPVSVGPDEMVDSVVRKMCDAGVGAVLVVEDGKLRSVFSERDLLTRVVADGRDPATTRVAEVSTEQVVTVSRDASIRKCAEALKNRRIRHLPVTEDGKPIAIISARDFFERITGELETLMNRAKYDAELHQAEDPYDHMGGSYGR